jgi:HNH endonuclease
VRVPWDHPRCVVCLGTPVAGQQMTLRSDAHVIPESLGGVLSAYYLCKGCNNEMGRMEGLLARDVGVRQRVNYRLQSCLPEKLVRSILNRLEYFADTEEYGRVIGVLDENGELQPKQSETIKSDRHTLGQAFAELDRLGASEQEKDDLRERFVGAGTGEVIQVRPGYRITRNIDWTGVGFRDSINDPLVGHEVPLGIGYLYLALCLGERVYDPILQPVRDALKQAIDGDPSEARELLPLEQRMGTDIVEPVHLLRAKQTDKGVTVTLQIWRDICWPIEFPGVELGGEQTLYRLDLEQNDEWWCTKLA